jgi:polyisoprenyl-phosphate glycosyltransferase
MPDRRSVSFVVPVYHEEAGIAEFHRRLAGVMDGLASEFDCDVVYVDDGSRDRTPLLLAELAEKDPRVSVIYLSRNFGHQLAITAGLDEASGDAVITIDGDLQDPPEVARAFIQLWTEGAEVVIGVRRSRAGEPVWRLAAIRLFYRIITRISDVPMTEDTGDFRLLDRKVVTAVSAMRESNRYLRGMIGWAGFRQERCLYDREPRHAGDTKYPLRKLMRLAVDGISSFSDRPLRLAGQMGILVTMLSVLGVVWIIVSKLLRPEESIQGWASVMVVLLFLGGVQLLTIGILGEYVGRIFRESKGRPLYIVARRLGVKQPPEEHRG